MSGGRCEKIGCNKLLYKSPVTYTDLNNSQFAHIVAHSKSGPRGYYKLINGDKNDANNLLLLCPDCHKEIDAHPELYSVEVLHEMKHKHEERIRNLTAITDNRECLSIIFSAPIGKDFSSKDNKEMMIALASIEHYSSPEHQRDLSYMLNVMDGKASDFEAESLLCSFNESVKPVLQRSEIPVAVFAIAPIPLLVFLGTLFPAGITLFPFQKLHHSTFHGTSWRYEFGGTKESPFELIPPRKSNLNNRVALVLETSGKIADERILKSLNATESVDIWRIRHHQPGYDQECSEFVINNWVKIVMETMNILRDKYGHTALHVFPAVNNVFALMFGVARVSKTDSPWIIYDNKEDCFYKKLVIGGTDEI